jgi:leukotriene-A4 hydrolase
MGSALHIPLPSDLKSGTSIKVKITYETTRDCTALQWLEKEYVHQIIMTIRKRLYPTMFRQTQGKKFPYLFSQCQPIYARTVAPLQGVPVLRYYGASYQLTCLFPRYTICKDCACAAHCEIDQVLSLQQKYSATVTSVLPVLLSAIRRSPSSEGPAHDGKAIGKDLVTYTYEQVSRMFLHTTTTNSHLI